MSDGNDSGYGSTQVSPHMSENSIYEKLEGELSSDYGDISDE